MAIDITTISVEMDTSSLRAGQTQLDRTAQAGVGLARSFAGVAAAFGAGLGVTELARKLVDTERVTGSLMASLEVATGSAKNAESAFASLAQLGSELPESLNDVTKAFTMMVNLGLDPSQAAMKSYSNTASAMNKSLMQMVEAVADATTGQYERLKEFGIKASTQGDKVAFTFRGTTTTVKNSADEITKYLKSIGENEFAGLAEKKMLTLDGAISNLSDSWDGLFRTINKQGSGTAMAEFVRSMTKSIQDLDAAIASSQVEGYIEAIKIQFRGLAGDIETSTKIIGDLFGDIGKSVGITKDDVTRAFTEMPQNIRAFIQIVIVELLSLSEKAVAVGNLMREALNPMKVYNGEALGNFRKDMERINGVRDDSIAAILKEKEATSEAAAEDRERAKLAREFYSWNQENSKAAGDILGQYKVSASAANTLTQAQIKTLKDLNDQITKESYLLGNTSKEIAVQYEIKNKLNGATNEQTRALLDAAKAFDKYNRANQEAVEHSELLKSELDDINKYFENINTSSIDKIGDNLLKTTGVVGKIFTDIEDNSKKSAESIKDSISDALIRGFEDGKGIAENFRDTLRNIFRTLVLKPVLDIGVDQISKSLSSIIGTAQSTKDGVTTKGSGALGALGMAAPYVGIAVAVGSAIVGRWNSQQEAKFEKLTAAYRQGIQSTGTVLGEANKKSQSISNALDNLGDTASSTLDVNYGMYQALLAIQGGIGASAAGLSRSVNTSSLTEGVNVGTKTNNNIGRAAAIAATGGVGAILLVAGKIIGGQFGGFVDSIVGSLSKAIYNKKTSIINSGIKITGESLADIIEKGTIQAFSFADVKTKKSFIGITTSIKVKEKSEALDEVFRAQFASVFVNAGKALEEASKAFGVNFDPSKLMIDATKLSLKGLEGDALTKEIESFFSATLDKWAGSLVDGLVSFQKVGEGAFETMVRLASQTNIFTNYAEKLLPKFNMVGFAAIEVTQSIAELAGGFDRLQTNLGSYYQNFFDDSERAANGLDQIKSALSEVGIAMPKTREEFRALVEGLDLTSELQQKQYAALLDVNQAFAQFVPAAKAVEDSANQLTNTFDAIADQQKTLSDRLFDLTASDSEKRKRELDLLLSDENRAIQQQINNVIDLNKAKEAQAAIDSEAYALETEILNLSGNTVALRARELALINPANQAKQKEIWALEDSKIAAELASKAMEDASRAQEQALNDAKQAADEQRRLAQGVHDSISGALKALMGESETLNAMTQSQARLTLQNALMTAKAGGSLVGFAGLDDALGAIQKQGSYSSSLESRLALGRNIGLLSELSKYTKVDGSHANGLESVPYDGYIAQLHKGERVQTAREAQSSGDLAAKVERLIEVVNAGNIAIAQNTAKGAKVLEKWDNDGTPEERSVA